MVDQKFDELGGAFWKLALNIMAAQDYVTKVGLKIRVIKERV